MRRYRFEGEITVGSEVELSGDLFKHIIVVCRNQIGNKFELLKNELAYLSEVVQIEKKTALLKVLEQRKIPDLPKPYVHLVLANPKTAVLEAVLEKSVELGVKSIYLLATERSFFKSVDKVKLKEKRLEKIISQALQQSNRHENLVLKPVMSLTDFLNEFQSWGGCQGYVLYEKNSDGRSAQGSLEGVQDYFLLVGAEGGFTPKEAAQAVSAGFDFLSLGGQILRVETACVAGVSILKSKLQIW